MLMTRTYIIAMCSCEHQIEKGFRPDGERKYRMILLCFLKGAARMGQVVTMFSFTVFVIIFIAIAIFFTLSQLQWARWLRKNGIPIEAVVMRSEEERTAREYEKLFSRAGAIRASRNAFRVQWTDPLTQKTYTYRRRNYRGPAIKDGDSVQLLVDPKNHRRYRMR
jgi:hypothetical protein